MITAKMQVRLKEATVKATVSLPPETELKFIGQAKSKLDDVVSEYARQLVSEAENEERRLMNASEVVEITARIIEDAKFQMHYRMRRKASYTGWLLFLQGIMGICTIPIGIGASAFDAPWGKIVLFVGIIAYVLVLIIHIVISHIKP
jgi:hypothetical protein